MGGTLTIRHDRSVVWQVLRLRVRGTRVAGGSLSGTLLGPEGTAVWSVFWSAGPSELHACWGVGVVGGWSLLENCTVDASICGQVFKGARWMPWH
jgi:hypothetical protein